jgi:ketosteroid isomerase-like protein
MTFLSEDPTYLAGALLLLAGAFAVAMRVTQQGKYLIWALSAAGLAVVVVAIERFWVTDSERIERVVYDLRRAVLASDAEGVLKHLTPDVQYVQYGTPLSGEATRELIRTNLANASFDLVHLRELQTSAGRQTRRGKAEFRMMAKGRLRTSLATYDVGTADSTWSLGFQETAPGEWKVNRITPVLVPEGIRNVAARSPRPGADMGAGVPGIDRYGSGGRPPYGPRPSRARGARFPDGASPNPVP